MGEINFEEQQIDSERKVLFWDGLLVSLNLPKTYRSYWGPGEYDWATVTSRCNLDIHSARSKADFWNCMFLTRKNRILKFKVSPEESEFAESFYLDMSEFYESVRWKRSEPSILRCRRETQHANLRLYWVYLKVRQSENSTAYFSFVDFDQGTDFLGPALVSTVVGQIFGLISRVKSLVSFPPKTHIFDDIRLNGLPKFQYFMQGLVILSALPKNPTLIRSDLRRNETNR